MLRNVSKRSFSLAKAVEAPHMPKLTQALINGKFQDAADGQTMSVIDPRTEQNVANFAKCGPEDVNKAVAAAREAFDNGPWPRMSGYQRGRIMQKVADIMRERADELAHLETLDNGKPLLFSQIADVPLSYQHFEYFAGWADKIHGEVLTHDSAFGTYEAKTLKEPVGVVGQIIPWNFPLLMAAWKLGPALCTGSTVVLKPSEKTPMTALVLGEILLEAGVPEGVVNILPGTGEVGSALASHPGVDKVAFTGSVATALKIQQNLGIKPFTTELGGKSPVIVMEDADVKEAAALAHWALFFNHGQCCCAGSRVFVHESQYDAFVEESVRLAQGRNVGDPFTSVDQGPQVDQLQFNRIMSFIDGARDAGYGIATGGARKGDVGYYIEPTILVDVPDDAKAMKEEIFGPVMGISKFSTEDEVISRANNSNFGLAAGLFSQNPATINRVSRRIRAGTVWVNCYNNFDSATPFGGYKDSGVGREKGVHALHNYLQTKSVIQPLVGNTGWYR